MFERFTDRARRVVVLAQEEARTLIASFAIDAIVAVYFAASRSRVPGLIVRSTQINDAD